MTPGDELREGMREFAWKSVLLHHLTLPGEHVIYVIEFEGNLVKVGQSRDFNERFRSHQKSKRTRGLKVVSWWWQITGSALEDERALIDWAVGLGGTAVPGTREWFTGVNSTHISALAQYNLTSPPRVIPEWTPLYAREAAA